MSILAINLPPSLIRDISRDLKLCCTSNVTQALRLLAERDFHIVVEDARGIPGAQDDLALLLAATPPGTRIYALVSNLWLPESEHWRSQGIQLIFDDLIHTLADQLQTAS